MLLTLFGRWTLIGRLRYFLLERNYSQTIRALLVILCLGLTLLSTFLFRATQLQGNDFIPGLIPIGVGLGLAVFVLCYNHLPAALTLVVVISTLLHTGIGTGTGTKISITFIVLYFLLAVWLFKTLVVKRRFDLPPSPVTLPIVLFVIVVLSSLLWSSIFVEPDARPFFEEKLLPRLMTSMVLIISPVVILMFAAQVRSTLYLRFIAWWFIAVGAVFVALRVFLDSVPPPLNDKGQLSAWVCALAVGQFLFNRHLKWYVRAVLAAVVAGWVYVTYGMGSSWVSGWLPVFAVVGIVIALYSRRLLLVVMIVAAIFVAVKWDSVQKQVNAENQTSGSTRVVAWERTFSVFDDHWLLGTGPAGYAFYFAARLSGFYQFSHNNYVDILAQLGIIGISIFVLLWLIINFISLSNYRYMSKDGGFRQGLAASLVAMNAAALLIMWLGDWVTPFTYTQGLDGIDYTIWPWIFAGLTLALYGQRHLTSEEILEQDQIKV